MDNKFIIANFTYLGCVAVSFSKFAALKSLEFGLDSRFKLFRNCVDAFCNCRARFYRCLIFLFIYDYELDEHNQTALKQLVAP